MDGVHDLGGMHGYGPVIPEPDEPIFHADWERRALAITLALGSLGQWNIDQSRHARESLPPAQYLTSSYYKIWYLGLERLIEGVNLLENTDLDAIAADELLAKVSAHVPYDRPTDRRPTFAVGDQVRARTIHPRGHTRLPRYARGHLGTIAAVRGAHVFPDRNAVALGEASNHDPEWLYTVSFAATELFGEDADPRHSVSIDAWEPYLEAAA